MSIDISQMPKDSDLIAQDAPTELKSDLTDRTVGGGLAIEESNSGHRDFPSRSSFPVPSKQPITFVLHSCYYAFAFLSLILVLAVLAAIPLVNFYVLGYFLHAEARVATTGRFRDGFPLLHVAPKFIVAGAGIWLFLLPLRFLAGFAADAQIVDPGSEMAFRLKIALNVAWFLISVHLILAFARGGTIGCFIRPIKNLRWTIRRIREGDFLSNADRRIQSVVSNFEVQNCFWLGLRGFAVAFLWLFVPTVLYTIAKEPQGGQMLLTVVGGIALAVVLSWAPFLQARFAAENRFSAGFQLREIRSLYSYAPIAWSLTTVIVYLLALPLYLFKAFLLPQGAMWPITFVFVLSIYPTRILTGWAYQRAIRKRNEQRRSHWSIRWITGGTLLPLLGIYVFILFFTQFLGEQGKAVLFQHHSLMLPSPF